LASEFESKLDQRVANGGFRGKSFGGNLGDRSAFFNVFFGEEILVFPKWGMNKVNGVNEMRGRGLSEERFSSRDQRPAILRIGQSARVESHMTKDLGFFFFSVSSNHLCSHLPRDN